VTKAVDFQEERGGKTHLVLGAGKKSGHLRGVSGIELQGKKGKSTVDVKQMKEVVVLLGKMLWWH